jgi:hypothetical protein
MEEKIGEEAEKIQGTIINSMIRLSKESGFYFEYCGFHRRLLSKESYNLGFSKTTSC